MSHARTHRVHADSLLLLTHTWRPLHHTTPTLPSPVPACAACLPPALCSTGTFFCVDLSVTAVVIKGLAEHKDELGAPLCPCRHYDDKATEAEQGFWNCPCVPMRERKVGCALPSPPQRASGMGWGVVWCVRACMCLSV